MQSQSKIPASNFVDFNKLILKFIWKGKRLRIANTILKKNKVEKLMLPDKMIECQQFYVVQLNINKLKDFHNGVELLFEKECIAQSKLRNYFEFRGFFISKTVLN